MKKTYWIVVKTNVHYSCGKTSCMEDCVSGVYICNTEKEANEKMETIRDDSDEDFAIGISVHEVSVDE